MADAPDLKSVDLISRKGSTPFAPIPFHNQYVMSGLWKDIKLSFDTETDGIKDLFKPYKKQEEFFNKLEEHPRVIFFGTPCGNSNYWVRDFFTKPYKPFIGFKTIEEHEMDKNEEMLHHIRNKQAQEAQECTGTTNEAREEKRIYFPSVIEINDNLSVSFTKGGEIHLKQGKNIVKLEHISILHKTLRFSNQLIDYKASQEAIRKEAIQERASYLRDELKHIEEK